MKKLLSILGIILMLFNGIAVFSLFATLPSVFKEEHAGGILLSYLFMLIVYCGMFYLGYRLNARFGGSASKKAKAAESTRKEEIGVPASAAEKKEPEPQIKEADTGNIEKDVKNEQEKPAEAKAPKQQKPAEPAKRKDEKSRRDADRMPKAGRGEVILYWDPNAEMAAQLRFSALYEIRACMPEGKPAICGKSYVYKEIGPGKDWIEVETDIAEIPADMLGRLSIDRLRKWLGSYRKLWNIDWDDSNLRLKMNLWCWQMSELASRKVPDCIYNVLNPFGWLDGVGPDGLSDESGIGIWLRMKENVTASEAIRALAATGRKWKVAILTENDCLLKEDGGLNADDLYLCERDGIIFCLRTGSDTFRDLADMSNYRIRTQEWPGSADDAATYGRWWLEKLPMTPKDKLDAVTLKIIADCRSMGIGEERIKKLLNDGLNQDIRDDSCRLTYDSDPEQYVVKYYERGMPKGIVQDADEKSFRFKFIRELVYHCTYFNTAKMDAASEFLRNARAHFSDNELYRRSVREYYSLFPYSDALPDEPNPFERVTFGRYPQTAEGGDMTPIEWLVLESREDMTLLLSRRALDMRPFGVEGKETTWGDSPVRAWLNEPFLDAAFSREEQSAILETKLDNSSSGYRWGHSEPDTLDRVFLLSYEEAHLVKTYESACRPTDYAAARENRSYPEDGYCTWILRNVMHDGFHVASVIKGRLAFESFYFMEQFIRPALWVRSDYLRDHSDPAEAEHGG